MLSTESSGGVVIVLNGAPRSGKSTVAAEIVNTFDGEWINLGVDSMLAATPPELLPAMGLRPGGERRDLEPLVLQQYQRLFTQVVQTAGSGVNVAMDVGLHDGYSKPLGLADELAAAFVGLEVLLVGVHCSFEELRVRRAETGYLSWPVGGAVPDPVRRWQVAVHRELTYDIEVDTSEMPAADCAAAVSSFLKQVDKTGT